MPTISFSVYLSFLANVYEIYCFLSGIFLLSFTLSLSPLSLSAVCGEKRGGVEEINTRFCVCVCVFEIGRAHV